MGWICWLNILLLLPEPFVVAFVKTIYTAYESEGQVEVCVNLTYPLMDIRDETLHVNVFNNESSVYIPDDAVKASMLACTYKIKLLNAYPSLFFSAPDIFDRLIGYPMAPLTDYEEQIMSRNRIRNMVISAMRRVVCYNQPIYNDSRLEVSEYAGLQLAVEDGLSALVEAQVQYDNAVILILDDDSQFANCGYNNYACTKNTFVAVEAADD